MSDVKHTPLPWSIVPQNDGSAMIAHEYQTGKQMNPKGLRLIAHVLARGNSLQMDEANAAVIVAAVNAYAALEKLCRQQHEALEYMVLTRMVKCLHSRPAPDPICAKCKADAASTAYAALFPKTGGAK